MLFRFSPSVCCITFLLLTGLLSDIYGTDQAETDISSKLSAAIKILESEGPSLGRLQEVAALYQAKGDFRNAAAVMHMALAREDATEQTVLALLAIYLSANEQKGALEMLESTVERFPESSQIQFALASLYSTSGQEALAFKALEKAVQLDPENPQLQFTLADAYEQTGRNEQALTVFKELSKKELFPTEWDLRYCQLLMQHGSLRNAVRRLQNLWETNPENPTVKETLLNALFKSSMEEIKAARLSRAQKSLEQALEIDPNKKETLMGLTVLHKQMGDPLNALKYGDYVLRIDPNNLKIIALMGDIERAEGMTAEAEATFKKGLEIATQMNDFQYIRIFKDKIENPL